MYFIYDLLSILHITFYIRSIDFLAADMKKYLYILSFMIDTRFLSQSITVKYSTSAVAFSACDKYVLCVKTTKL